MKIGLATYFFPPDINPRAFRVFELARHFAKMGHAVDIYVPDWRLDYPAMEKAHGFQIIPVSPGFWLNRYERLAAKGYLPHAPEGATKGPAAASMPISSPASGTPKHVSWLSRLKTRLVDFMYMGGFTFEYFWPLYQRLARSGTSYDLLISVALPMAPHLGTALALRKRPSLASTAIAEYGDPYAYNSVIRPPRWHRWLEKWMMSFFQYITIPIAKALPAYTPFKPETAIRIIPQGIDFAGVAVAPYTPQPRPTFMYAGNFYKDVRNPTELLTFLQARPEDFRFVIYTNTQDPASYDLIRPFVEADPRFEARPLVPRDACIWEMSQMDFLVNIQNTVSEQQPSKLIDYYLAKRPIFSYQPGAFDPAPFAAFLAGDYRHDIRPGIDIQPFAIETVCQGFLDLAARDSGTAIPSPSTSHQQGT